MGMSDSIRVEVIFADQESQHLKVVELPLGATVSSAIELSGLQADFPNYDFRELTVGVWGRVVSPEQTVRAGDRIEIYRGLQVDPMEARRIRATAPDPDPSESH